MESQLPHDFINQPLNKYDQMRHAQWHGCTLTDLIFPFFLLIVGISCWHAFQRYEQTLSLNSLRKIVRRAAIIFIIGLALNICKQWISRSKLFNTKDYWCIAKNCFYLIVFSAWHQN